MPLNIEVLGDAASVRSTAADLRSLAATVHSTGTDVVRAGAHSESSWIGAAADAFRAMLRTAVNAIDEHVDDLTAAVAALERFAADLDTVKARMKQAAEIASAAGLTVTDKLIMDPGPAPVLIGAASLLATAQEEYAKKVSAYQAAAEVVDLARGMLRGAEKLLQSFMKQLEEKATFMYFDGAIGLVGAEKAVISRFDAKAKALSGMLTQLNSVLKQLPSELAETWSRWKGSLVGQLDEATARTQTAAADVLERFPKLTAALTTSVDDVLKSTVPHATDYIAKTVPLASKTLANVPIAGGLLAAGSVVHDVEVLGKDPVTSTVSNYGGLVLAGVVAVPLAELGAGVLTIAAIGAGVSTVGGFLIEETMNLFND
ncbi:WXG100 family type VII secretion target [Saccharopolyspora sp. 5N102]|uniref:WXG100 family type VII secretion target n=1 Tax=Saccharopolyspora sp. 5N102 TaxID=3375155 RepID=UPI0037B564AA